MRHPEKQLMERLGKDGLARVLDELLDQPRLVRLANACGLRYPGMRTQSQRRERILRDLVERAEREEPARRAVFRALRKEARGATRAWGRLSAQEKKDRLQKLADSETNGELGLHLFLLAQDELTDGLGEWLPRLLAHAEVQPAAAETSAPDRAGGDLQREIARVNKKVAEQQKKNSYLEAQLAKTREHAKTLKRDLIQRKGELAESRLLVERLRSELKAAQGPPREAGPASAAPVPAEPTLSELAQGVRRLAAEQRRLTHDVRRLAEALPPPRPTAEEPNSLTEALQAIQREIVALRRERKKETREQGRLVEDLRAEIQSYKAAVSKRLPAPISPRRNGEPERVGVFIDVQNMYYGARRLEGKLDFDALMQAAVRDRRLIRASAYVVESTEHDQSGFISILEQRGIGVRRKTLKVRADRSRKGDWDMEMALDILDAAPKLDVVVLVSGDGDFTPLVNRIKQMGPRVEVIGWPRTTAKSLVEAADQFQPLDADFMIRSATATGAGPEPAAEAVGSAADEADLPARGHA